MKFLLIYREQQCQIWAEIYFWEIKKVTFRPLLKFAIVGQGWTNPILFCACSRYKYCLTNNLLVVKLLKSTFRGKKGLDISMYIYFFQWINGACNIVFIGLVLTAQYWSRWTEVGNDGSHTLIQNESRVWWRTTPQTATMGGKSTKTASCLAYIF